MKAIIVEDSSLARDDLRALLEKHPEIDIIGEAAHPDEAEVLIAKVQPELIFLDIHMPGRSGFELLEELQHSVKIIFTTAYVDFAIRSFDYNTIDYLVKPIHPKRLARAIARLHISSDSSGSELGTYQNQEQLKIEESIFIRDGERCLMVPLKQIERFDSHGNYSRAFFYSANELGISSAFISKSLAKIEQRLPPNFFFRANRQQIVNLRYIEDVNVWINGGLKVDLKSGKEMEISRRNSHKFKQQYSL
jgi:two-component system LytT family response regulator